MCADGNRKTAAVVRPLNIHLLAPPRKRGREQILPYENYKQKRDGISAIPFNSTGAGAYFTVKVQLPDSLARLVPGPKKS